MKRLGLAICVGLMGSLAASAQAAFPGRNGVLAVQPSHGPGIVLVKPDGRGRHRECAASGSGARVCSLARPEWSPDGRALAVEEPRPQLGAERSVGVIYRDGSCLVCDRPDELAGGDAAFSADPTLLTVVSEPSCDCAKLVELGIDGLVRQTLLSGRVSDPVWSSAGELAVVRRGSIWVGSPPGLHRLVRGSNPSWSPDGARVAFDRNGWLMVRRLRGPSAKLARGTAPAWSPDGRLIAFFDRDHRLSVIRSTGGWAHRVGNVTGTFVDWQPRPAGQPAPCLTPSGSTVIASSDTAMISLNIGQAPPDYSSPWAVMGCLRSDGRERVLDNYAGNLEGTSSVSHVALAGAYAAVVTSSGAKGCGAYAEVQLFDLRTGATKPRQDISTGCGAGTNSIDHLVLGDDGVFAAHTTVQNASSGGTNTIEEIQASDSTGAHTLDSITEPNGSPTALTNLTLTGDTLTWEHNGTPHSAQLVP